MMCWGQSFVKSVTIGCEEVLAHWVSNRLLHCVIPDHHSPLQLITDDGDKDTDTVSLTRLRPIYGNDDSRTKPLQERICGTYHDVVVNFLCAQGKDPDRTLAWENSMRDVLIYATGEPVDCWYDDGWWEGYVHITRDTELVVFFPSNGDLVTIPYDQSNKPEDQQKRLRCAPHRPSACHGNMLRVTSPNEHLRQQQKQMMLAKEAWAL